MKQWLCVYCWHEVLSDRQPEPINWTDGHTCTFKSPADIDTSRIISFERLLADLEKGCDLPDDFPNLDLKRAYDSEVTLMLKYGIKARQPLLLLHPFRTAGSQHIAEFEVKDLFIEETNSYNFHGQNTSQWVYAGAILYDERDNRVSTHH